MWSNVFHHGKKSASYHHFESLFNCTLISEGRKVGGYIVMTAKRSNCQNWDVDMRRPTRFFNIWEEAKR